ncbi:Gfo/Idh/MocA family protein [Saccharopolyspora sp. NPDC002578]
MNPSSGTGPRTAWPVRVAMVGLGWAARSIWLPRLHAHPAFTVAAAVDPDPAARTWAAAEGMPVLAAPGELDPADVDLAVVAVPNHLHCPVAVGLLEQGIPVFLEKPVCLNEEEADRLAAAERLGGGRLLAGSAARCRADVRALHDLAGRLGALRYVDLTWTRASGVPDSDGWFTRRRLAGGGALVDLGWHLLDVAAPLLGAGAPTRVIGTTSSDFLTRPAARAAWRPANAAGGRAPSGDVEDTVRAFLVTDTGIAVSLRASWASHEPCDVTSIRVEGDAGAATLRCTFGFSPNRVANPELVLLRSGHQEQIPLRPVPVGAEYDRQLDELPVQLADPTGAGRAVDEARRTARIVDGVYASAATGREVPLGDAAAPVAL